MAGFWHWVIALSCIASFFLALFVCLLVTLLNLRAPHAPSAWAVGPFRPGVVRDRPRRAVWVGRSLIPDRVGYPTHYTS